MIAQHFSRYFIFRMAFMIAMIALGLCEVRVSIAGFSFDPDPSYRPSCPSDSPPGVIHVLLIGVGQYPQLPDRYQLRDGPANDLALLSQTLLNKGVKPENITLLIDSQATVGGILTAIDTLQEKAQCGDQVIIHFSGMAFENGLITFDTRQGSEKEWIGIITGDMLKSSLKTYLYRNIPTLIFIDASFGDFLKLPTMAIEFNLRNTKFATFHSIGPVPQTKLPTLDAENGKKDYGLISWCLAKSLTEFSGSIGISDLAATINRCFNRKDRRIVPLSFHATDWDMRLNFPSAPSAQSSDPDIEFVNLPPETRGFRLSEQPRFRLEGRIQGPDKPSATLVNKDVVEVLCTGQKS